MSDEKIKGMAHITGGGIEGNLKRIIPDSLTAEIDLSKIRVLPLFKHIKNNGNISEAEMLSTFNCGVGLILVIEPSFADIAIKHIEQYYKCYPIGKITSGHDKVVFSKNLTW
jgi:phosphoribosylformylglycinamidine cyclo-ligase